jgi:SAM-dependent methyltransferase
MGPQHNGRLKGCAAMQRRLRLPGSDLRELLGPAVPGDHSRQQPAEAWVPGLVGGPGSPPPRVLDLGCGPGASRAVFHAARPDVRWTGLDVPDSPSPPPEDPDIRLYDGERIPFGDGAFDVVFCKQVLEHVRDPRQVLAEVARVLAPGGVFAGSTSQLEPFHARSTFGYTAYGFALLVADAGLELREVRPGIDGPTLIARAAARRAGVFGRWFARDSPFNRAIDAAGRVAGASPAEVNAAKLKFCGQFAFLARRS